MEIDLEITDLSRSGPGLGRDASGRVVFVPLTAPGDKVRVAIVAQEKRYAEGKVVKFHHHSSSRITPICPVFGVCGGCQWQHLQYSLQWETKKSGISHSLARVNVDTKDIPFMEFPAEKIWEYRNRIQLRGFASEIGFLGRGSNKIVPIEKCYIARPEINARIPLAKEHGKGFPRDYKLELEVFQDGNVTETWNAGHSAQGFRQVHDEQNLKLKSWVGNNLESGGLLLDLYGGSGNLSLEIAKSFQEVHCVDVGAPAKRPDSTPTHFHFHRSSVLDWLRKESARLASSTVPISLVLDPPREGLGNEMMPIIEILKTLPVRETLIIGCDPDQWARATSRFLRHGWSLRSLGALDFFPQTSHIEALAVLKKNL